MNLKKAGRHAVEGWGYVPMDLGIGATWNVISVSTKNAHLRETRSHGSVAEAR